MHTDRLKMPALLAAAWLGLCVMPGYGQAGDAPTPAPDTAVQSGNTAAPSFEVASIRLVDAHAVEDLQRGIGLFAMSTYPTGRFFMHNTTLDFLVAIAYGVDMQYIQKDRDWMDSQLYDIDARVEGERPLSQEEIRPLLRNLLEQRFHVTTHRTSKLVAGFVMVAAKGGVKLKPGKEGVPTSGQLLPNRMDARSISASTLASFLARPAGQPVVDKTGLVGSYDVSLSFAPANDINSTLPSLFTAIQEQLGLKLEPAKVPIEHLVIDSADRVPTEN